jgi:hypothetical protein
MGAVLEQLCAGHCCSQMQLGVPRIVPLKHNQPLSIICCYLSGSNLDQQTMMHSCCFSFNGGCRQMKVAAKEPGEKNQGKPGV